MCLSDISPGQSIFVTAVTTDRAMRRRLFDIGLVPGTRVTCVGKSPMGDPAAFLIRGAVIALRLKDCENITVNERREDNGSD